MKKIRVLVVDDSASMRGLIASVLRAAPDIEVVGQASDPLEAREAIKSLDPDVVTLDVEMPKMNGLDFLERLMRLRPTPVIMVSNLTSRGGEATIRALELGAVDCIAKPNGVDDDPFSDLLQKIRAAALARAQLIRIESQRRSAVARPSAAAAQAYKPDGRVVAIGSSTGGVEALVDILSHYPENCPPTVIAQHMPATFMRSFAMRLDRLCAARVTEAADGDLLKEGHVYIAPGGTTHHLTIGRAGLLRCRLTDNRPASLHCPSVDVLFASVARTMGPEAIGVILTGMGRDGAQGLLSMRQSGAETIGQDEKSSLIYGMPRSAYDLGAVSTQLPLRKIGQHLIRITAV